MKTKVRLVAAIVVVLLLVALYRVYVQSVEGARAMAVNRLLAQLKNADVDAVGQAGLKLAKMGPPAIKPLIAHLGDKDWFAAAAAEIALGKMGAPAIEPLETALKTDPKADVRAGAAIALGDNKDPHATATLIAAFGDRSRRVGHAAALSFWRKHGEAVAPLLAALKDKSAVIRSNAAMALGGIKDKRASLPLIETLRDPDKHVRLYAAQALGFIGDPRAVAPLLAMFQNRQEYADGRHRAADALAGIGDVRAIQPLIGVLKDETDDEGVRMSAAWALGRLDTPAARNALKAAFSSQDRHVADKAHQMLLGR